MGGKQLVTCSGYRLVGRLVEYKNCCQEVKLIQIGIKDVLHTIDTQFLQGFVNIHHGTNHRLYKFLQNITVIIDFKIVTIISSIIYLYL